MERASLDFCQDLLFSQRLMERVAGIAVTKCLAIQVILDFMDLSKLKAKVIGSTVCLFGGTVPAAENRAGIGMHVCIVRSAPFAGQDIVLRLFLPTVEEADQWAQKLSVAQLPQLPLYQLSFDFK